MYPVLFQVKGFSIFSYGLMLAVALVVGIIGVRKVFRAEGYPVDMVYDLVLVTVVCGIVGARAFYVFFYAWDYFRANPWMFFDLRSGGLVFYGSFLGGLIGALIYVWMKQLLFWEMADIFAPYLALGYAIARIGCFLNGCCYGKPTSLPWGVVFPGLGEVARHPTQIYSSLVSLGLFGFLYWLYPRRSFRGQVFLAYSIGYAVTRFIIEFWRENLVLWQGLTVGQVVALAVLVVAVPLYLVLKRLGGRPEPHGNR